MIENNDTVKVEVVPGVEVEITDMDKATAAASEETLKAEIEVNPRHTCEDSAEEDDVFVPMGTASLADILTGNIPAPTDEEVAAAVEEQNKSFQIKAKEKLKDELARAKDKSFAEPIIEYLLGRCEEDTGLAEDVCQSHKTWKGCFDYIYSQAKKAAKNSRQCAVRNDVVFEWAEDYYHADDKAEAKAKKEAENKAAKKREEAARKETTVAKTKKDKNPKEMPIPKKAEKKKAEKKPTEKKNDSGMMGQMSMFDFI